MMKLADGRNIKGLKGKEFFLYHCMKKAKMQRIWNICHSTYKYLSIPYFVSADSWCMLNRSAIFISAEPQNVLNKKNT